MWNAQTLSRWTPRRREAVVARGVRPGVGASLVALVCALVMVWLVAGVAWAAPDAGASPDAPAARKKGKPASPKVPAPRKQPSTWKKIKDGMGKLVPKPVKKGWKSATEKWEQAQALYKAMKKFAGWDEETLRRKRIAAAKKARKERWKRADEKAEQQVIRSLRMQLWRRSCFAGSARSCRRWSSVEPKTLRPQLQLRELLWQRKQWKKLLPVCQKLHQMQPKAYRHRLCLARVSVGLKRADQALGHYQQLTRQFPSRGVPWLALGQLHLAAGRNADALKACTVAVERMPRDTSALACLGGAQLRLKQKKKARETFAKGCNEGHIEACQQVRALRPSGIRGAWVWSKMNTRINALRVGRSTRSNSCYVGIQRSCRLIANGYRKRAKQMLLYQRPYEALAWLRKATRIAPFDAPAWRALGEFLRTRKLQRQACHAIQRSLKIDGRQPKLWMHLGQCRESGAQTTLQAARQAFRRACALGHNRACLKVKFDQPPSKR